MKINFTVKKRRFYTIPNRFQISQGQVSVQNSASYAECASCNNPLTGVNDDRFGPRFPSMTDAYNV